jgi:hypothetical protein
MDPWLWLMREGHRVLKDIPLSGDKSLKVDGRRHRLDAVQQALLEEQLRFRWRSRDRFPDPARWLWTDRSLQQASDWISASFKAGLIAAELPVVDACCGAGVDLVALAAQHRVVGIDRDRRMTQLARANLRAHDQRGDLCIGQLPDCMGDLAQAALHIDPDRRAGPQRSSRTTQGEAFSPSLAECMRLGERARAAIIKLAPATEVSESELDGQWSRCWLGTPRECPQQLLFRGEVNLPIPAGRVAAVLCQRDGPADVYMGQASAHADIVSDPEEFVYEPHPALFAAGLAAAWSAANDLMAVTHPSGYFTGPRIIAAPWAQAFRVLEVIAWDDRRVRKWLRAYQAGTLEVKSRLVNVDASQLQRKYSQPDGRPVTCLLTRSGKGIRAIMAERTNP